MSFGAGRGSCCCLFSFEVALDGSLFFWLTTVFWLAVGWLLVARLIGRDKYVVYCHRQMTPNGQSNGEAVWKEEEEAAETSKLKRRRGEASSTSLSFAEHFKAVFSADNALN